MPANRNDARSRPKGLLAGAHQSQQASNFHVARRDQCLGCDALDPTCNRNPGCMNNHGHGPFDEMIAYDLNAIVSGYISDAAAEMLTVGDLHGGKGCAVPSHTNHC
jgi:hypothetical protein